ncbi:MAG: FAD-dependent oxidoreductase [Solirubrobacteraceae bacterium]|nr:FAD-dependent oxidoreductase [Solirubrobacteraceae bacterium]
MPSAHIAPLRVVIAGGGVAALETLMALHDLGEQQLRLTVVAPDDDFVLRPMSVAVPFSAGHVTRVPLDEVCAGFGARRVRAAVAAVDAGARRVTCHDGAVLDYDVLVLATGADTRPAYRAALTFSDEDPERLNGLLRDIEQGSCASVALVVPPAGSWALPVYELALMLARHARDAGVDDLEIHLVTPEPAPLAVFGAEASDAVARLLADAGIRVHAGSYASVQRGGRITLAPGDRRLHVARVVALPVVEGRPIPGVPADDHGFVPVDDHCRVIGVDGVYAVGDGADFPVKQGGLAAQQADVAARDIAAAAGADVTPEPFRPVLRGMLLTGGEPRFLRRPPATTNGTRIPPVSTDRLWWPPTKVVGRYLAPWLAGRAGALRAEAEAAPGGGLAVEAELAVDRDAQPLSLSPLGPLRRGPRGRW